MDNVVIITSVTDKEILAVPMISGNCISCERTSCAKQGKPFPIDNPKKLAISKGSVVKIVANKLFTTLQGFIALILPIFGAIGGFFVGKFLSTKYSFTQPESIQALGVIVGLILVSLIVYFVSSQCKKIRKSEIVEIIDAL